MCVLHLNLHKKEVNQLDGAQPLKSFGSVEIERYFKSVVKT